MLFIAFFCWAAWLWGKARRASAGRGPPEPRREPGGGVQCPVRHWWAEGPDPVLGHCPLPSCGAESSQVLWLQRDSHHLWPQRLRPARGTEVWLGLGLGLGASPGTAASPQRLAVNLQFSSSGLCSGVISAFPYHVVPGFDLIFNKLCWGSSMVSCKCCFLFFSS